MADFDSAMAAVLDELLPPTSERGDWARVLRDAEQASPTTVRGLRPHTPTRRVAFVLAAVALAALIPLVALAADNGWWFFSISGPHSPPAATSSVVLIEQGKWQGTPWALTAYRTRRSGLCIGVTPNPPSGPPPTPSESSKPLAIFGCGAAVRGVPDLPATKTLHELAFYGTEESSTTEISGLAASNVASVRIVHADGSTTTVPTVAAPGALKAPVRFFVALISPGVTVSAIRAIGQGGSDLETVALKAAPTPPKAGTNSRSYTVEWGS